MCLTKVITFRLFALTWPTKWCILLGSSSKFWYIASWGSWYGLPGVSCLFSEYLNFSPHHYLSYYWGCCFQIITFELFHSNFQVLDIRSKTQIYALWGHANTVCSVFTQPTVSQDFYFFYAFQFLFFALKITGVFYISSPF